MEVCWLPSTWKLLVSSGWRVSTNLRSKPVIRLSKSSVTLTISTFELFPAFDPEGSAPEHQVHDQKSNKSCRRFVYVTSPSLLQARAGLPISKSSSTRISPDPRLLGTRAETS